MKSLLKLLVFCFLPLSFYAQVEPITLFQQFNGRYDFTGVGNTLNESPNPASCELLRESSADLMLQPDETIVSAHLYWSSPWVDAVGGDYNVALNSNLITATRDFHLTAGTGVNYFSAYADVTNLVIATGNGTYTFSGLDQDLSATGACNNGTGFGGWAMYVIYENPALTQNQVTIFDGLEFVSANNTNIDITLGPLDVASDQFSKIGFLAWEGDASIANNETLLINTQLISDVPLNPADNAFNGTNSYTNSNTLFNMDLDAYDLIGIVAPGDSEIDISLTSSQDFVMVNNIITNVNSEIPDATITIDGIGVLCENSDINVDYTVFNTDSTEELEAGVPIAFYADGVLVGQTQTTIAIPIGFSESGTITLNFPPGGGTPVVFTLLAVVDDDGTGMGTVDENNEDNNEFELLVDLSLQGLNLGPDLLPCVNDIVTIGQDLGDTFTYQWFFNGTFLPSATDAFINPTLSGTYRLDAFQGICFVSDEVEVTFQPNPIAAVPDDLRSCDGTPNDGFAEFDLTIRDAQIQNGQPGTSVSYYISETAAEAGAFPITPPNAFTNTMQFFQTVYARLEDDTLGCIDVVPLDLIVDDSPAITDPISDYFICDLDGDGLETFDLTSKDSEILNTLVDVTLSYHESQADALAGVLAITPANAYVSSNAVVWVRAVNYLDGDPSNPPLCVTVGQFNLLLGQTPIFNVLPEITACDDEVADGFTEFDLNSNNFSITGGDLTLSVTYHATQAAAENGLPAHPVFYTNVTNPEEVWVRVENQSGCYGIFMSELVVIPRPIITEPDPLIYCDDDNDGFGTFTLTDASEQVVGGNPAGTHQVSYHVTLADAINGVLPLMSPYDNEVPFDQIIYVRLTNLATGCYNTTTLHLLVEESPQITDPQPLVVCDTDGDGFAVFNLTDAEPDILQGLTGGPYVVTYFTDMAMTSPIINVVAFTNTINPQTLYITVRDTNNDCESETTLELRVEIPPTLINPSPLELCDEVDILGPDDEVEVFDLTSKISEITGGALGVSITFFETQADMQGNVNEITNPTMYQNVIGGVAQNPQTIWFRANDVNSTCIVDDGMATLDLIVNPLPSPVTPTALEVCDIDNDGFADFILTDKDIEIIGGEPGVVITYHETRSDAENGIFALTSPYSNLATPIQVIYARATYDDVPPALGTGCWRVVELELIVNPTPIVPIDIDPIIACDMDMDGFETFDLTQREGVIYGTQDPADYSLDYFLSQAEAEAGTPAIANPNAFINTITPLQTIWVRLEDTDSECFKIGMFDIEVVNGPTVIQPDPFTQCDDLGEPFDGITTFDLTSQDDIITGGAPGVGVQYYETLANAEADIDAINPATAYVNTVNLQTIYVRVTDGNTLCIDTTVTLTLRVVPNPAPEQPDPISLCDLDGDGEEIFDLTIRATQILDGETYDLLYYELEVDAIAGIAGTEIIDPTAYTNTSNPQIIYIRVTNPDSDGLCFEIVELTISVNALPDDTAVIEDYIICEVPFDGLAIFDLTTKNEEILIGQDMVNHSVSFYEDPGDAMAGINPIPIPTSYQNTSNPQMIYVGITNTATTCYIGGVQFFNIEVREGATATAPAEPYVLCDEVDPNDGFTLFDLSVDALEGALWAEILNGQDPLEYTLTFHETQENAMDGTNGLGASYTNIINPQIIYARVEKNDATQAILCHDIAEVILKVNQLPVVVLPESYRLCIDENGNPIEQVEGEDSPPVIDTGLDASLYSFVWTIDGVEQEGETASSIIALAGGMYEVTITQLDSGCSTTVSTTVTVSQPPVSWSFNLINGAFGDPHAVEIIVEEGVSDHYVYSLDDGPFQDSNIFENVSPGTHTIIIKDANGCGEVSFEIGVVDYPDYFTPNQDGVHDTWNIIGIADFDPTANIYIFDRYGKLLKQISPLTPGWDGTYNGNALPSSDYWFKVEYTEQEVRKEIKGHFALKR